MIKEHTILEKEKGTTSDHIDICQTCPFPASKCNGECDYYKEKARELKQTKKLKKNVIIY
jgi:hypothetical protein